MSQPAKFGSGFLGHQLKVHDNRVEVISGCWPFRRKRVIPFSQITNVETHRLMGQVIIHTGGDKVKFNTARKEAVQKAIVERM